MTLPAFHLWESAGPVVLSDRDANVAAARGLSQTAHDLGQMADSPIMERLDLKTNAITLYMATPKTLRMGWKSDAFAINQPAAQYVRFYYRDDTERALAYLARTTAEVEVTSHHLSDEL